MLAPRTVFLAFALALLLGCEAPMLLVHGRVATEEGYPMGGFDVYLLQVDEHDGVIGRDSARVAADGTFGDVVLRRQLTQRLRLTAAAPGYPTAIVDVPITNDSVAVRRDLVLRH